MGKSSPAVMLGAIALVLILGLVVYQVFIAESQSQLPTQGGTIVPGVCASACPDTLTWSGVINLENALNTSAVENYDATAYFFKADGSLQSKVTDTTSGTLTLTCGESYTARVVASGAGENADAGNIKSTTKGSVDDKGVVSFTACGSGETVTFRQNQHGAAEIRAKDLINDAFMYYSIVGAQTTAYVSMASDSANFTSTVDNATAFAVGASGELDVRMQLRAVLDDADFNDLGIYVLIDAPAATWNEPTVKIDGAVASEASALVNSDEKVAFADYEYVYFIPASRSITNTNDMEIELNAFALSGVNPGTSDDITVAFAPVGTYESTQVGNTVKIGAVKDNSAKTAVYKLYKAIFQVS